MKSAKKQPKPVYTDISVIIDNDEGTDPEPFSLKINTNRLEPILPYKIASAKLPYRQPETRIIKKAYQR